MTGRGAGLDDVKLQKRSRSFRETIERCDLYQASATEVLAKVGGFDIAAMAGACMGAAIYEIPLILDGLISMVAALAAERLLPGSKDFLIASHASRGAGNDSAYKRTCPGTGHLCGYGTGRGHWSHDAVTYACHGKGGL